MNSVIGFIEIFIFNLNRAHMRALFLLYLAIMKRLFLLGMVILGFFIAYGCSSKDHDHTGTPSPPNGGEIPDPSAGSVVRDSTNAIYRQFFFTGTHNSYSGNLGGMKREGIATQLKRGLRFFEFDLYSFNTQKVLQTTWTEPVDALTVFEYMNMPYFLSYTKTGASLKIYKLDEDNIDAVYSNTGETLDEVEREFSILAFENTIYVLAYEPINANLIIYSFNGANLTPIYSGNLGSTDVMLSSFIFDGRAYAAVHSKSDSKYKIMELSITEGGAGLENPIYEQSSIPPQEELYPFWQENDLYIFRHNVNTVTNFRVESIDTTGDTWSTSGSQTGSSELLFGSVRALQANGKLFVNSYAANGRVIGSQLMVDKGKPNLILEYNNESDMLSGANASVYPLEKGFFLLLQKDSAVQLSSVSIGQLILGHDAPGDEVDLSVDNPSSILLDDWISFIADWSNDNPDHEPLFIMTELKEYEQWLADAKWQNIIRLMQEKFGNKLRFHSSSGFHNEALVAKNLIVDGKTLYFMDQNGSKEGGLLGKVVLYIQPNNNITKSDHTNNFRPFFTTDGILQENFDQLRRYRENNKLVSPDWRNPGNYGNDIGHFIDSRDDSYISRIFHMQSSIGDGQYDNIRCADVMFAVSDRPYEGLYTNYVDEQKAKNKLEIIPGCD